MKTQIRQYDVHTGELIATYKTQREAAEAVKCSANQISYACWSPRTRTAKGFRFVRYYLLGDGYIKEASDPRSPIVVDPLLL